MPATVKTPYQPGPRSSLVPLSQVGEPVVGGFGLQFRQALADDDADQVVVVQAHRETSSGWAVSRADMAVSLRPARCRHEWHLRQCAKDSCHTAARRLRRLPGRGDRHRRQALIPGGLLPGCTGGGRWPGPGLGERRTLPRTGRPAGLLAVSCVVTAFLSLPLAPVGSMGHQVAVAVNPEAGETVGWESYVATVRDVAAALPPAERSSAIILARNYGEAGALSRVRRLGTKDATTIPPVYSGHNAFGTWGPPPESSSTAIVVGRFPGHELQAWFTSCR